MITQEVLELIYKESGSDKLLSSIDQLSKSTANYEALIEALDKTQKAGDITIEEMISTMGKYGSELSRETKLLNDLIALRDRASTSTANAEDAVYDLADTYDLVEQAERKFVVTTADATVAVNASTAAVKAATAAQDKANDVKRESASASKAVAASTANVGRAVMETTRLIEDMQYGFAGAVNNIPGVVMAFGGPMGLASAISLVSIGINQLINHWDDVTGIFTSREPFRVATAGAEELKKRIEELEKKPVKLTVDIKDLDAAKGRLKDIEDSIRGFQSFQGVRSKEEREAGSKATEALGKVEGGTEALIAKLKASIVKDLAEHNSDYINAGIMGRASDRLAGNAEENARLADRTQGPGAGAQAWQEAKRLRAEADAARKRMEQIVTEYAKDEGEAEQVLGKMFQGVSEGNKSGARTQLVEQLKKVGEGKLAEKIGGITPESVKAAHEREQARKTNEALDKDAELEGEEWLKKRTEQVRQENADAQDRAFRRLRDEDRAAAWGHGARAGLDGGGHGGGGGGGDVAGGFGGLGGGDLDALGGFDLGGGGVADVADASSSTLDDLTEPDPTGKKGAPVGMGKGGDTKASRARARRELRAKKAKQVALARKQARERAQMERHNLNARRAAAVAAARGPARHDAMAAPGLLDKNNLAGPGAHPAAAGPNGAPMDHSLEWGNLDRSNEIQHAATAGPPSSRNNAGPDAVLGAAVRGQQVFAAQGHQSIQMMGRAAMLIQQLNSEAAMHGQAIREILRILDSVERRMTASSRTALKRTSR